MVPPPTASASSQSSSSARAAPGRPSNTPTDVLACRVKYSNVLPDIPFDPKFLIYPFDSSRFVQYKPTSLEKHFKWDLLAENDLGVHIDLILPETYAVDDSRGPPTVNEEDAILLEEDATGTAALEQKRSAQHCKVVPWLRKTEYISSELHRYGAATGERTETKVGAGVKKKLTDNLTYRDRQSQIDAIQKQFDAVKKPEKQHYSKRGVYAVQESPLLPDHDLWKMAFAQVMFDSDPTPVWCDANQTSIVQQALIRGMMDESGEQFVAYFLPTPEMLEKVEEDRAVLRSYKEGEVYEYKLAREYNWNVKNKASKGYEENHFFIFRNGGVFYNELETRVRLNKRRHRIGEKVPNSRLMVLYRPLSEAEEGAQQARLTQLESVKPPEEEDVQPEQEGDNEEDGESEKGSERGDGGGEASPKVSKRKRSAGMTDDESDGGGASAAEDDKSDEGADDNADDEEGSAGKSASEAENDVRKSADEAAEKSGNDDEKSDEEHVDDAQKSGDDAKASDEEEPATASESGPRNAGDSTPMDSEPAPVQVFEETAVEEPASPRYSRKRSSSDSDGEDALNPTKKSRGEDTQRRIRGVAPSKRMPMTLRHSSDDESEASSAVNNEDSDSD